MNKDTKQLETMIEELVEKKLNGINEQLKKLDDVCEELSDIKRLLAGDKQYNIAGMKYKQDEMWENHLWWRENMEDAKSLLESFKNWRWFYKGIQWWIGVLGLSTVVNVIIIVANFLSSK